MDTRLLRIRHSRLKCGGDYRCSQSDERRGDGLLDIQELPLQSKILESYGGRRF